MKASGKYLLIDSKISARAIKARRQSKWLNIVKKYLQDKINLKKSPLAI